MVNGKLMVRPAHGLPAGTLANARLDGRQTRTASRPLIARMETGLPTVASYLTVADFTVGSAALIA